jgi:hypothetical protein
MAYPITTLAGSGEDPASGLVASTTLVRALVVAAWPVTPQGW